MQAGCRGPPAGWGGPHEKVVQNPHYSKQNFARKVWAIFVFKKVLQVTQGLEVFYVVLLGLFSCRFGAGKQVGAQSGFGGVELLENFVTSWV